MFTRSQQRSRRAAGDGQPQGAKGGVKTGLKGGGGGGRGRSKSQYRQRSRYLNVPPASLGGVRLRAPRFPPTLMKLDEGASPSPHKIIYTRRIEMTDGFSGRSDIFKVDHKRQGTSEMEENHYSPGLRSSYHASAAKAGEGTGTYAEGVWGGGRGGWGRLMFLCMSGKAANSNFIMPFPLVT